MHKVSFRKANAGNRRGIVAYRVKSDEIVGFCGKALVEDIG